MNYKKVQKALASEPSFIPRLAVKDKEVSLRGQKLLVPTLVWQVGEKLREAGYDLQTAPKNIILALASGIPTEAGQAVEQPTPVVEPTPTAAEPPVAREEPKRTARPVPPKTVTVKGAKTSDKAATKQAADTAAQFIDSGAIHRYQCAIASAQLLAALSQLFEKDQWPGCEERRKKLDDLIDDVEKASTQHVNLSVKQIIRAQAGQKTSSEG